MQLSETCNIPNWYTTQPSCKNKHKMKQLDGQFLDNDSCSKCDEPEL